MKPRIKAFLAKLLILARHYEKAEALLSSAVLKHPNDHGLAAVHASAAHAQGRHRDAAERWVRAGQLGARGPFVASRHSASLRMAGEHLAAQNVIHIALTEYPNDIRVLTEAARLAEHGSNPRLAAELWLAAIKRAKPHADWLQGYCDSLLLIGNLQRASRVIASARRQYPSDVGLIATDGKIALARQEWTRAIAVWTEHGLRSTDDTTTWESLGLAVHDARLSEAAKGASNLPSDQTKRSLLGSDEMRNLLLGFESIGDDCELGLVQRRFGAEPLGLLRWNDVALHNLLGALESKFDGVGDPANTSIVPAANGELFVTDHRWQLDMHTFLHVNIVEPNDVLKKMCRRIAYLREKLIEDLSAGQKIFVYRSSSIGIVDMRRLHHALRAYGPVKLLCAQPILTNVTAFAEHVVGLVDQIDEGLYFGALSHPSKLDVHGKWHIDFDTWTEVLSKTKAIIEKDEYS